MTNIVRISLFLISAVLFMIDPSAEDIKCVRTIEGDNAMQTDAEFKEVKPSFGFIYGKRAKYCHEKVLRTAKACATQVCITKDGTKLILWKDCVDSMDFCNGSGINTAECEKHNMQHQCLACEGDYCNAQLRFTFIDTSTSSSSTTSSSSSTTSNPISTGRPPDGDDNSNGIRKVVSFGCSGMMMAAAMYSLFNGLLNI